MIAGKLLRLVENFMARIRKILSHPGVSGVKKVHNDWVSAGASR